MSWDIFVMGFPADAKRVEDIPSDFRARPIGARDEVIDRIKALIPSADFSDPSWGHIVGDGFSIEVNLGHEELSTGFVLHVRGGDAAVGVVSALIDAFGLRGVDTQTGGFFTAGPEAIESFRAWRAYRDKIVGDK